MSSLVVAKVGTYDLRAQEFANRLALKLKNFDALTAKSPKTVSRLKNEVITDFIVRSITEMWAKENQVVVSASTLDNAINKIRSSYPNDLTFRRNLALEHLSFNKWKSEVLYSLLQKELFKKIRADWKSPDDLVLREYYNRNKALFSRKAQIQIRQIVTAREDKAKLFQKKLRQGKSFKNLVQYSAGPESKNQGITDWIDIDTLAVFKQAYRLPKGARSPILKSPFGFHIIKVLGKRPAGHIGFDAAKTKIRKQILEKQEQELYSIWLDEQIRRHSVFKNKKIIASISVVTKKN